VEVEALGVDVDGETQDRADHDQQDASAEGHLSLLEDPSGEPDREQDKDDDDYYPDDGHGDSSFVSELLPQRLVDVVGFPAVLAGMLALALDPRRGDVCLLVERLGPGLGGLGLLRGDIRLLGQALGLGLFGGRVLALACLLMIQAAGLGGVGLGLVAVGLGPRDEPFLLSSRPSPRRPESDPTKLGETGSEG
jgi:hypothetical protein